jgi:putative Ca2+/H+ antiporter (TMEM165/GDT1 family)
MRASTPPNRLQLALMIAWPAFVFAGVATTLFFASFDPEALGHAATFPMPLSRMAGYTVGFLLFWVLGIAAATGTVLLLRPFLKQPGRD